MPKHFLRRRISALACLRGASGVFQLVIAAGDRCSEAFAAVRNLSDRGDLREAAANLFRYLRELDALGLDLIVAERVPSRGLGAAIMDRLERASHR